MTPTQTSVAAGAKFALSLAALALLALSTLAPTAAAEDDWINYACTVPTKGPPIVEGGKAAACYYAGDFAEKNPGCRQYSEPETPYCPSGEGGDGGDGGDGSDGSDACQDNTVSVNLGDGCQGGLGGGGGSGGDGGDGGGVRECGPYGAEFECGESEGGEGGEAGEDGEDGEGQEGLDVWNRVGIDPFDTVYDFYATLNNGPTLFLKTA